MASEPKCLVCGNVTLGVERYDAPDNASGFGPFCSDSCMAGWRRADRHGRMTLIFGNLPRGIDLAMRVGYGQLQLERAATQWVFTDKPLTRPESDCPTWPAIKSGHSVGCPDCRIVEITWTEVPVPQEAQS